MSRRNRCRPDPAAGPAPHAALSTATWNDSAVALDDGRSRACVVNQGQADYSLSVVDTTTRTQLDEIDILQNPVDVAVDTQRNRIYVANAFEQSHPAYRHRLPFSVGVGPGLTRQLYVGDFRTGELRRRAYGAGEAS